MDEVPLKNIITIKGRQINLVKFVVDLCPMFSSISVEFPNVEVKLGLMIIFVCFLPDFEDSL